MTIVMLRREAMCSRWLGGAHAAGPVALWLTLALVAPQAVAGPSNSPASVSAEGARTAPKAAIRRTRLDNGLRIVLSRDTSAPTVAVCLTLPGSASTDARRERDRVHVLEHLLLNTDPDARPLHRDERDLRDVPSIALAETTHFVTLWPAHALAVGLERQAQRLKGIPIADGDVKTELRRLASEGRDGGPLEPADPGAAELRQRVLGRDDAPGGDATTIGASDLQKLHREYFTPGRAVLSISGDFEILETLRLIREHFGAIDAGPTDTAPAEVETASARPNDAAALEDPDTVAPHLLLGWELPASRNPERTALDLVAQVLGGGETSRLFQMLVREQHAARGVEVWTESRGGRDLLAIRAVLHDGANPSQVRRSIQAHLNALARFGPTPRELARAKDRARLALLLSLEGNLRRATRLAEAELVWNDAGLVNGELDTYDSVSGEQIARAVARHLTGGRPSEVLVSPPSNRAGGP